MERHAQAIHQMEGKTEVSTAGSAKLTLGLHRSQPWELWKPERCTALSKTCFEKEPDDPILMRLYQRTPTGNDQRSHHGLGESH